MNKLTETLRNLEQGKINADNAKLQIKELFIAYEMGVDYKKKISISRVMAELKVDRFLKWL